MRSTHRLLLTTTAAACVALTVSAQVGAKKVTIKYSTWGESSYINTVIKPMVKQFEAKYPNISVNLQASNWEGYHDKLLTSTAAGLAPDLMAFSRNYTARLASARVLAPLEPFAKGDRSFSFGEYVPTSLLFTRYKSKTYGLPWGFTPMVLYYNKDMFKKAGLEEPYDAFKADRWSWTDFLLTAKKLTGKAQNQYGSNSFIFYPEGLFQWIASNGGNMVSEATGKPTATDALTMEAIQFVVDLKQKHEVVGGDFLTGKTGMMGGWMGYTESQVKIKPNWDVGFWPKGKGGSHTEIGGVGYGIASASKHPEEAWLLLKFLTGEEIERQNVAKFIPPTRKALLKEYGALKTAPSHKDVYEFYAVEAGVPKPLPVNTPMFESYVNQELDKAYAGKVSVDQACKTLQARLVTLLRK